MNGERWTVDGLIAHSAPADCEFVTASDYDALAAKCVGYETGQWHDPGDVMRIQALQLRNEALEAALREAMDDKPGWYDSARAALQPTQSSVAATSETEGEADDPRRDCPWKCAVGDPKCICVHDSDCALHRAPALPVGPCNCSHSEPDGMEAKPKGNIRDLRRMVKQWNVGIECGLGSYYGHKPTTEEAEMEKRPELDWGAWTPNRDCE